MMTPNKYTLTLPQSGKTITTSGSITLLELLRIHNIPIATACSGEARCGLCEISVINSHDTLHPPTIDEREILNDNHFAHNKRLACQIWVESDLTIETDYW